MVAPRRSIVDALNRAARDLRIAAGELSTHSVEVNGASFAVGDRVIAQRNDYAIGLLNGTRGTVINLDHATGSLVVEIRDQGRVDVPRHYVDAGDLVHGYATTIHKAQGATADIALVWIDDQSYREAAYTGLSRGRIANHAYVVTTELAEAHFPQLETGGAELLRQAVTRSAAQQLAVQHVTLEAPWV
jgi:ATP-dependent exoDNAse (exonuclease V) alpha subunit